MTENRRHEKGSLRRAPRPSQWVVSQSRLENVCHPTQGPKGRFKHNSHVIFLGSHASSPVSTRVSTRKLTSVCVFEFYAYVECDRDLTAGSRVAIGRMHSLLPSISAIIALTCLSIASAYVSSGAPSTPVIDG